jgi:hypothetical protein
MDDIRPLLLNIIDRIDAQVPRLDAIDVQLKRVSEEARSAREKTEQLGRLISAQSDQLRTLSDGVAVIASIQADTSKMLGDLTQQVARLVEGNVRGRTSDAQRYTDLEARVAELELQVRALAAAQGRP